MTSNDNPVESFKLQQPRWIYGVGKARVVQAERRWNMNTHGDAHVSFHATQLRPSPDGRHLLVSTSAARLLVLPLATAAAAPPRPVASLHGLRTDTFHLPCTAWHPAGAHVLAADCTGAIQVCCAVQN